MYQTQNINSKESKWRWIEIVEKVFFSLPKLKRQVLTFKRGKCMQMYWRVQSFEYVTMLSYKKHHQGYTSQKTLKIDGVSRNKKKRISLLRWGNNFIWNLELQHETTMEERLRQYRRHAALLMFQTEYKVTPFILLLQQQFPLSIHFLQKASQCTTNSLISLSTWVL